MLLFETLKIKKSDFLNSNTCQCSRLYGNHPFAGASDDMSLERSKKYIGSLNLFDAISQVELIDSRLQIQCYDLDSVQIVRASF